MTERPHDIGVDLKRLFVLLRLIHRDTKIGDSSFDDRTRGRHGRNEIEVAVAVAHRGCVALNLERRIASGCFHCRAQFGNGVDEIAAIGTPRDPARTERGDASDHSSVDRPADPDRNSAGLARLGHLVNLLEGKFRRAIGSNLFAPQQLADLDGVIEQSSTVVVVKTARVVFFFLPSDPDTKFESTTGEYVDCCSLFRQHRRCTQRGNKDRGVETDSFGEGTDSGEHGERFEPVAIGIGGLLATYRATLLRIAVGLEVFAVGDVIADRNAIDTGKVGRSGLIEDVSERTGIILSECAELNRDLRG